MNTNILRKCLEELSKDEPKLDYIRGMLETLIEMQDAGKIAQKTFDHDAQEIFDKGFKVGIPEDEVLDDTLAIKMDAEANIAKLKALGMSGTQMT